MGKKSERRRKERWNEIWLGDLFLHSSSHGLGNIILDEKVREEEKRNYWDEIWLGVLALHSSSHGLGNIILFFDPLRKKAWQELLRRRPGRMDLRYIANHCDCEPFREEAEKLLEQTKKSTRRVVKI